MTCCQAKRMAWPESSAFWTFSRSCLLLCKHCIQDWQVSVIKLQDWNRVSVVNTLMVDGWTILSRILNRYGPMIVSHVSHFGSNARHLWVAPFFVEKTSKDFTFYIRWCCCHWCLRIDPRVRVWTLRWSSHCCWKASCIKCWPSDVAGPGDVRMNRSWESKQLRGVTWGIA